MLLFSAIVMCLAIYLSINLVTITVAKISKGVGTIDLLPSIVPSFLWALFYYLVNL